MKIKNFAISSISWVLCKTCLGIAIAITAILPTNSTQSAGTDNLQIPIRGIVRASATADISTELTARVAKVALAEGEAFNKGELLVRLDCRRQSAEHEVAKARYREANVGLKSALFLKKRKAASRNEVDIARAKSDAAASKAQVIGFKLEACAVHAPYAGRIAKLNINQYEMTRPSNPLLSIVALDNPQIELIVPSEWLTWLAKGAQFNFTVDETGKTYSANVMRMGATVIAVNQTIQVFARFTKQTRDILPGMSGTANFEVVGQ